MFSPNCLEVHFSAICFLSERSLMHQVTRLLAAISISAGRRDAALQRALELELPAPSWPRFPSLMRQERWPCVETQ